MTAELTRRLDGEDRHPWDWYVEQEWVTAQLLAHAPIDRDVIALDPCCGSGNIIRALEADGREAFGMDLFDRGAPNFLGVNNMLGEQRTMFEGMGPRSIVFNPPFSYQNGKKVRRLAMQSHRATRSRPSGPRPISGARSITSGLSGTSAACP